MSDGTRITRKPPGKTGRKNPEFVSSTEKTELLREYLQKYFSLIMGETVSRSTAWEIFKASVNAPYLFLLECLSEDDMRLPLNGIGVYEIQKLAATTTKEADLGFKPRAKFAPSTAMQRRVMAHFKLVDEEDLVKSRCIPEDVVVDIKALQEQINKRKALRQESLDAIAPASKVVIPLLESAPAAPAVSDSDFLAMLDEVLTPPPEPAVGLNQKEYPEEESPLPKKSALDVVPVAVPTDDIPDGLHLDSQDPEKDLLDRLAKPSQGKPVGSIDPEDDGDPVLAGPPAPVSLDKDFLPDFMSTWAGPKKEEEVPDEVSMSGVEDISFEDVSGGDSEERSILGEDPEDQFGPDFDLDSL